MAGEGVSDDFMESRKSALRNTVEHVMAAAHASVQNGTAMLEGMNKVRGFFRAVDWTEPWILTTISLYVTMIYMVWACRKHVYGLGAMLCFCAGAVLSSERLNHMARMHWRHFSQVAYFDKHGVFFSIFVSLPMLLIAAMILIVALTTASRDVVRLKTAQFRKEAGRRRRDQRSSATGGGGNGHRSSKVAETVRKRRGGQKNE